MTVGIAFSSIPPRACSVSCIQKTFAGNQELKKRADYFLNKKVITVEGFWSTFNSLQTVFLGPGAYFHPLLSDGWSQILRPRPDQAVVGVLLQNVRRPARHPAHRKNRREQIY